MGIANGIHGSPDSGDSSIGKHCHIGKHLIVLRIVVQSKLAADRNAIRVQPPTINSSLISVQFGGLADCDQATIAGCGRMSIKGGTSICVYGDRCANGNRRQILASFQSF